STFGNATVDDRGERDSDARVIRNVVEQAVLADRLGLDFFNVGEHHRPEIPLSAPDVVLAAIAGRTERIKLGTAVVVLSTDDPVRVQERFATLDAVSGGRAELTVGRGSFVESFPLYGFDLKDYDLLFEERLDLLTRLRDQQPVTWSGQTRAPLRDVTLYPRVEGGPIPTWVAVGGSPESVVRAARHGLPLMLAVIGGSARRFRPYVDLYHQALAKFGQPELPVGMHSPGHVADDAQQARDDMWEHTRDMLATIGRERGWPPPTRERFDADIAPAGAKYVGTPEQVARSIAASIGDLGLSRFELQYGQGTLPHDKLMRSIELFATSVVPRVRELVDEADAAEPERIPALRGAQ
ncbi:MAG: LLM class flavin-dependent oxidoreductase, partial [Actinobacteria bacterium]|nr:LLM class flavin-dependent oxidoreductase [Actinomycetota bacterium]